MSTTVNAPSDVSYYQPARDSFSIVWKINPTVTAPVAEDITLYDFILQVDVVNTFDSINLQEYTIGSPQVTYQDGYFYKAFVLNNFRAKEDVVYYYRVKVSSVTYLSDWSTIGSFTKNKVSFIADADFMVNNLPDKNTYTRQGLRNYFNILQAYAKEVEAVKGEAGRIGESNNFYKVQDSGFYDVLGVLMQSIRNTARPWIEYRGETLALWESFLKAGTNAGVIKFIKSLMGMDPVIISYKNRFGWIINDVQSPYVASSKPYWDGNDQYYIPDPEYPCLTVLPQVNSRGEKAFTWLLRIYNPYEVPTRRTMLEYIISKIKPVNTYVLFEYWKLGDPVTVGWGSDRGWGDGLYWGMTGDWYRYTPED